jgi:hypothetical protein
MSARREGTQRREIAPLSEHAQRFVDYTRLQQQETQRQAESKQVRQGESLNDYTQRQMGDRYDLLKSHNRKRDTPHLITAEEKLANAERSKLYRYYKSQTEG